MKKKPVKEEPSVIEARKEKAAETYKENQKQKGPGPVTSVDVARLMEMPEDMVRKLFGDESTKSVDNMTGTGTQVPESE